MNYIKILILFSAVFCMETFGMAYIQRRDLLCEKPLSDRIKYLFPMTPKRRIFYGLTLLTGPFICPDLCVSRKYNIYSKDPNGSFIWDLVPDCPH